MKKAPLTVPEAREALALAEGRIASAEASFAEAGTAAWPEVVASREALDQAHLVLKIAEQRAAADAAAERTARIASLRAEHAALGVAHQADAERLDACLDEAAQLFDAAAKQLATAQSIASGMQNRADLRAKDIASELTALGASDKLPILNHGPQLFGMQEALSQKLRPRLTPVGIERLAAWLKPY